MTTQQEKKFKMFCATRDYLEANVKITKGLPEFEKYLGLLKITIGEIMNNAEVQKMNRKGVFVEKKKLRDDLILLMLSNANKLRLYAMLKKKEELENDAKFNPSDLKNMPDSALVALAKSVYNKSESNPGFIRFIREFNITRKSQNEFSKLTISFEESIVKGRQVIN